jgi:hypothetical protein
MIELFIYIKNAFATFDESNLLNDVTNLLVIIVAFTVQ